MKAVSVVQPWAQLIVDGRKPHETRSWALPRVNAGEWLAVHASKSEVGFEDAVDFGYEPEKLSLGAIVGLARFSGSVRTEYTSESLTLEQQSMGDYTPGRWAWPVVEVVKLATPVPCRGALGIWQVPDDVAAKVEAQR